MESTLFIYILIYTMIFSLICLIKDIFLLDDKSFFNILKTLFFEVLFSIFFFVGCVVLIIIIQMGFDQMDFLVLNDLYYMAVPIVISLFVYLTK